MLKITKNQGSIQVTADKSGFYPFDGTITFPTNSLFTATSANTDMITFKSTSNGDVQFVGNYKDITISGRSYDTKQKFLTAFSNLANQGSVDAYTKAETDAKIDAKQGKLKAGHGITLTEDATDNTTVVKTAVSLTDNGNGAYEVGDSIAIGGRASVRIGNNNNVLQGQNSIVIGDHAMTNSENCIAIGNSSEVNAGSTCSIVIGDSAIANGSQNIAIGDNRRCDGTKNVSIGCGKLDTVDVNGDSNVCIGENSNVHTKDNANVNECVVIGKNARSESYYSVAIGKNAFSQQANGIAIGAGAGAEAMYNSFNSESIAIGTFARADGENSIALGYYSKGQKGGVAIGYQGKASAKKGIAIGEWALANVENGVAIGELAQTEADKPLVIRAGNKTVDGQKLPITMIQGDANGKISLLKGDGTDERMVIQDEIEALKNAGGSGGGTVDAYTKAETDTKLDAKQDKLTAGSGITITKDETAGTSTIATAVSLTDNGNGAYQVGGSIKMGDGITIGKNASGHNYSVAVGDNAIVKESFCSVIGPFATSYGGYSVAVGRGALINQHSNWCVAVGDNAQASNNYTVSIGSSANANKDNPLVINAGYKTVDGVNQRLTVLQSDSTGKLSILKGDGTDERIVIQDALSAGGSGGSANPSVNVKGTGSATIPDDVTDAIAIGSDATAEKIYCISVGYRSRTDDSSVAIGSRSRGLGSSSVAIGSSTGAVGGSVGIGAVASASGNHSVAIGNRAQATNANCVAIGYWVTATTNMPLVIGAGSMANGTALPMIQGDSTGKISILLGDGTATTMCLQDEIAALKAEIAALKGGSGASTGDTTGA